MQNFTWFDFVVFPISTSPKAADNERIQILTPLVLQKLDSALSLGGVILYDHIQIYFFTGNNMMGYGTLILKYYPKNQKTKT